MFWGCGTFQGWKQGKPFGACASGKRNNLALALGSPPFAVYKGLGVYFGVGIPRNPSYDPDPVLVTGTGSNFAGPRS